MAEEIKKETRDQKAIRELREKQYGHQIALTNKKMDYIRNIINGRYYLERCNMIADQLISYQKKCESLTEEQKADEKVLFEIRMETIKEKIDGCPKYVEYFRSEYAVMKLQAITSLRNAYFAKQSLIEDFKQTQEQIEELEKDYYDGKIVRESYDEEYKRGNKAEFVDSK